jgi:hypothetical protein
LFCLLRSVARALSRSPRAARALGGWLWALVPVPVLVRGWSWFVHFVHFVGRFARYSAGRLAGHPAGRLVGRLGSRLCSCLRPCLRSCLRRVRLCLWFCGLSGAFDAVVNRALSHPYHLWFERAAHHLYRCSRCLRAAADVPRLRARARACLLSLVRSYCLYLSFVGSYGLCLARWGSRLLCRLPRRSWSWYLRYLGGWCLLNLPRHPRHPPMLNRGEQAMVDSYDL